MAEEAVAVEAEGVAEAADEAMEAAADEAEEEAAEAGAEEAEAGAEAEAEERMAGDKGVREGAGEDNFHSQEKGQENIHPHPHL